MLEIKRNILTTPDRNWSPATHAVDTHSTNWLTEKSRFVLAKYIVPCLSWSGCFSYKMQQFITVITEAYNAA